jgi:hypothetical protein
LNPGLEIERFRLVVPFAAGFVGANLGRSIIGTVAACAVLAVLAVATYQSADADRVTGPSLRSPIEVVVPTARVAKLESS